VANSTTRFDKTAGRQLSGEGTSITTRQVTKSKYKNIRTLKKQEATSEVYKEFRNEPLIIRNELESTTRERLSWQKISDTLPDIIVQAVESLATARDERGKTEKETYYCKLHDYISYCNGGSTEFTVQTGPFDIKNIRLSKEDRLLYVLSLNCNKDRRLTNLIRIDDRFDDWFGKYFPRYTKEVVYDKGHTWFFIGPEGTESELHSDHDFVHTTLQQCDGTKEVFVCDPETTRSLIRKYGLGVKLKAIDEEIVMYSRVEQIDEPDALKRVRYGILNAGDTLYIPSMWGHMARAMSKSITMSRDFIDERNADDYFSSMIRRSQQ